MFHKFINIHLWLLGVFLLHRGLSFEFLNRRDQMSALNYLDHFLVGAMSDFWIASLGAALVTGVMLVLRRLGLPKRLVTLSSLICVFFVILLAFFHQSYVIFFKADFFPGHFKYLIDPAFVSSNMESAWSWQSVFLGGWGVVLGLLLYRRTWARPRLGVLILCVASVPVHGLNIRWRVQHFIQQPLQMNLFEMVGYKMRHLGNPKTLSESELQILATALGRPASLDAVLTRGLSGFVPTDLLLNLKQAVDQEPAPIFLTVLLESARPADFGAYHESGKPSLTPNFDQLARSGALFSHMYSTGSVTRGGQEAIWCGHLSSAHLSLMRERTDLSWDCLPRLADYGFLWVHGGKGEFDNQRAFWGNQGVDQLISQTDYPEDALSTGWGVSDHEVFQKAAATLGENNNPQVSMILSMTNHIPWDLPGDEPDLPSFLQASEHHPSFRTTWYTDWALGRFVSQLKQAGVWQRTLMVVVSDHGMDERSYYQSYSDSDNAHALLKSHSVAMISGGLYEANARAAKIESVESQAGLFGFWAYLLDVNGVEVFAKPLLFEQDGPNTIYSDLEEGLYLPHEDKFIPREKLLNQGLEKFEEDVQIYVLHQRAYHQFLNESFAR